MRILNFCAALIVFALGLISTLSFATTRRDGTVMTVPAGHKVHIDGQLAPGEWAGARLIKISIRQDWKVTIRVQHDAENLYFAFQGLRHGSEVRFPELLVDSNMTRSVKWQQGDFWLHSSFNLCEGQGEYNVYERNGVFLCSKVKNGWSANHFPLGEHSVMEIQVSFRKLNIRPAKELRIGFAIDLTEAMQMSRRPALRQFTS